MDCSNPVKDSTRQSLRSMLEGKSLRARQNLAYLQDLAAGAPRVELPALPRRDRTEAERKQERLDVLRLSQVEVSVSVDMNLDFLERKAAVPVCGLMYNNTPIHAPGVNQIEGRVSVARHFGGVARDMEAVQAVLQVLRVDEIEESLTKAVYTRGTARGFEKRLREQMTRKCVSVRSLSLGGQGQVSLKEIVGRLERLLPLKYDAVLPSLEEDLVDLVLGLETSSVSSAGAPYWRPKPDALHAMLNVVLPKVHGAIANGTMEQLYKEQPELFLCEVKNKLDRYEVAKLDDKCRPYTALPFHFQALFSILSQNFNAEMQLFHEVENSGCANAYGFSMTKGGGTKLMKWASETKELSTPEGRPKFYCYGDDADFWWRANGNLWRVSPDFRQMDGSVDYDCMRATIEYVMQSYEKLWGPNPFWRVVADWWLHFASQPDFLVNGSTVYSKKQKDGLMTGVVGTTLFDTAKAVLTYDQFATEVHELKAYHLLEEKHAIAWFRERGLEIKEGTWAPQMAQEAPVDGILVNDNLFLGVQMKWSSGPTGIPEIVPNLPFQGWLDLLLTPRDDPADFSKAGIFGGSKIGYQRKWFDRLRGYFITGAFSNDRAARLVGTLVNNLVPTAILMSVQANGGRGEGPELMTLTDEVVYPDSSGFPNWEWAANLYYTHCVLPEGLVVGNQFCPPDKCARPELGENNDYDEPQVTGDCVACDAGFCAEWVQLYPTLVSELMEFRKKTALRPKLNEGVELSIRRKVEWDPEPGPGEVVESIYVPEEVVVPEEEPTTTEFEKAIYSEMAQLREQVRLLHDVVYRLVSPAKTVPEIATGSTVLKQEHPSVVVAKPHVTHSPKVNFAKGEYVETKEKFPTMKELVVRMFEDKEVAIEATHQIMFTESGQGPRKGDKVFSYFATGTPLMPLHQVAQKLGVSADRAESECRAVGLYVIGARRRKFVSKGPPLVFPGTKEYSQVQEQAEKNKAAAVDEAKFSYANRAKQVAKQSRSAVVTRATGAPIEMPMSSQLTGGGVSNPPPLSKTLPPRGGVPKAELREERALVGVKESQMTVEEQLPKVRIPAIGWRGQAKEHVFSYIQRVFNLTGYKLLFRSEASKEDQKRGLVTTRAWLGKFRDVKDEMVMVMEAKGSSSQRNSELLQSALFEYVSNPANHKGQPEQAGLKGPSWSDEVEHVVTGTPRLVDETGRMILKIEKNVFQADPGWMQKHGIVFDKLRRLVTPCGMTFSVSGTRAKALGRIGARFPTLKLEVPVLSESSTKQ